jgi:hypothetical protein
MLATFSAVATHLRCADYTLDPSSNRRHYVRNAMGASTGSSPAADLVGHESAARRCDREIMVRPSEFVMMMVMMMTQPGSYGACAGSGRPSADSRA